MDYLKEFIKIVSKFVKDKEVTEETELKNLGIDSLDLVEIIMDVEEQYNITFEDEELKSFVTVGDVVKAIKNRK